MHKLKALFATLTLLVITQLSAQNNSREIWIDVRTIKEYQQEHLDGAVNIPYTEISQRIGEVTDNKQASIHLYCVAGVRAQIARQALQSLGYEKVINEGGLKDLTVAQ